MGAPAVTPSPVAVATAKPPPAAAKPALPSSTPTNELTMKALRLLRTEKGNLFFSGSSVRGALAMTALGAKGTTLDEMSKSLGVSADPAENVASAKKEAASWKSGAGKADLVIANRLWVDRAITIEPAFTSQASEGYGAAADKVDFSRAPDPSRLKINKWVSEKTKAKIPELLPQGSISELTRVVLTNAIYFKGNWAEAFKKEETKDESFQAPSGTITTPMMHRTASMGYAETDEVSLVELPYKDSDLALLVALPKQADRLDDIESDISGGKVDGWAKSLGPAHVVLSMPKFTFSWGRSIKPELEQLGIKAAFSSQADFSGISGKAGKSLALSDVFHKAFVLVDEVGTEAAAATGAVTVVTSMPMETVMKVDHPFLFFVRNKKSGDVLFAGRVSNPKG
jgi:serpin B